MRIQHKTGEVMQVDWAGNIIPIYDSVTGEESAAYLFVAVLPCSCFAYVEACTEAKPHMGFVNPIHRRWILPH
jgi:transposase